MVSLAFDVGQLGRRVNLVYAIGNVIEDTPAFSYVSFFLVPEAKFDELRPIFEAIAKSCSARANR